ncbi:hypothetical protein CCP4SC76_7780003 [Gammaproteobacteria bacterium]
MPTLAASGEDAVTAEAYALTRGEAYPLVCLDYQMPGMDGIETARKIAEVATHYKTHHPLPKIILMTTFCREERLAHLIKQAGISVLLSKPINQSHLFDTIMELFGQQVVKRYRNRGDETDYIEIIDRIGGTRLLLVEDIPINQQLARELLAGVGIIVDVANNGAEAVQMVELNPYDAVLMDIQMPVMDGYEATQAIRREFRFAQLPIIAMTAHAMASDQEKSLAAGMNDHISKPIDPDRLFSLLMTHIKPGDRVPVDKAILRQKPGSPDEMSKESRALREIPGFDLGSALHRVMGNQALLKKLLLDFKRDYGSAAREVRGLFAQGEMERGRRLIHQVKGIAGNIGARAVQDAARTLELAIEQGQNQDWPLLIDAFETALQEILTAIAKLQPSVTCEAAIAVAPIQDENHLGDADRESLKPAMMELAHHLSRFSASSTALFNAIKPLLLRAGLHQEVEQMSGQIEHFKFREARTTLESIAGHLGIS